MVKYAQKNLTTYHQLPPANPKTKSQEHNNKRKKTQNVTTYRELPLASQKVYYRQPDCYRQQPPSYRQQPAYTEPRIRSPVFYDSQPEFITAADTGSG